MAKRFDGKVVIVTGSTSGIGQAAAYRVASEGASVTLHGRNPEGMKETVEKLKEMGVGEDRIQQVFGDVKEEKTLHEIVDKTVEKFGKIDVLVNNAGNSAEEAGLDTGDIESIDHILDMNLKSVIKLSAYALPHLEKTKGNIVNVSSVDAFKPHPEAINYSVSKAALDHYTRNACVPFAQKGIRINNLNPGYIHTNIKPRAGVTPEGLQKFHEGWVKRNVPLKRPGESKEMANIIAFLGSDEASFMTGSCVVADGGLMWNFGEPQGPNEKA
ncbi:3-oxoacyl-[acyl-carrier-protein] reductase FabG-like [Aphelenchoides fujianensis]|nr:3-oxoacyl-[acyl-carrier-protein] reductase FabG-like [Aphelenchoides fujianensis]